MSDDSAPGQNRVSLLTPVGAAAIATIRLTGPRVEAFLAAHFNRTATIGRAVHGDLVDGQQIIEDPLVAKINETTVELHVHGGSWVIERTLELAAEDGFRLTPSPPPLDGVDCSTEIEREVLESLPSARTEEALRLLLHQPTAWQILLDKPIDPSTFAQILSDRSLEWMLRLPRVAIIGPPNVGKSTVANQLFGQQRSITADQPGTTRDWVGEIANLDGLAVMLLDTPGVRASDDAIEMTAIERASGQIEQADLIVVVADAEQPDDPVIRQMLASNPTAVYVVNKIDRVRSANRADGEGLICTNGLNGDGVDVLRREIRMRFCCEPINVTRPCCWTDRQREILKGLVK